MAKFFFHVRQGDHRFEDTQGIELADLSAAWQRAYADARMIVERQLLEGEVADQWMEIGDATGAVLAAVPFKRALQLN